MAAATDYRAASPPTAAGTSPFSSEVESLRSSPPRAGSELYVPHLEDRLACRRRAVAMPAPAIAAPSPRLPLVLVGRSSPSTSSMYSSSRASSSSNSRKRKSPCATISLFRSPLSRMMLSPRIYPPGARLRSPSVRQGTSTSTTICRGQRGIGVIDLNVALEEETSPSTIVCRDQTEMGGIDLNAKLEENDEEAGNGQGDDEEAGNGQGDDKEAGNGQGDARRKTMVPDEQRRAIFDSLLARARNGYLKPHETTEVAAKFSVHVRTVQRIWKKGKTCLDQGLLVDVSSEKKRRCGRKKIEIDVSTLSNLSILERTTLDDMANHFGISKSKLHRMKKAGEIHRVSSTMKPLLTDKHKEDRLKWCLRMLDPRSIPHDPVFQGLFDYVYIDERWYNISKTNLKYYATPGEQQPIRTCKNKNFIPKIMILTVVARPRFDSNGNCTFDGKIGCFAFVAYVPAKRSSVNRPAGTIEMKAIDSVTKDVMRAYMIEKVLPAVRAKWPREDVGKPIYIQQDNAKPHISTNDRLFLEAAKQDGFDIRLVYQPALSPDLNILDLGFFNALQSIQYKTSARTTQELVTAVEKAFEDYPVVKSNRIFLTLHGCMKEIMRTGGGNGYDIPHIRKEMLERQGCLPLQLKCDAALVNSVMAQVN